MSTPSDSPNFRSSMSFGVIADAGSGTPGALMPLCSPSSPPSTTVVSISLPSVPSTRSSTRPSASSSRSPGRTLLREPLEGRRHAARARRRSRRWRCAACRPASTSSGRAAGEAAGADLRTGRDPGGSRPRSRRASTAARMRAKVAPCDSCVPCEKFRRKMSVPAAISASSIASESLAGPTVAMIFVCRISSVRVRSSRSRSATRSLDANRP